MSRPQITETENVATSRLHLRSDWPNRDPIGDWGFIILARQVSLRRGASPNLYSFAENDGAPTNDEN